ncbi:hypothetical protein MAPG_03272 [Magnaporthiopsis poae ATCC 64411]|uniref:Uncharacterized protein n=1 Tax=Magnaporthiopsis poae (strain ATCC 64411 / 73-15) TaxID=644358 RepID=A0A0C4DTK3_MAGP6|nr:hypothetical protein MAPG_03272 [Magnaporthiopsis poae ATCC 64411]
MASFRMPKRLPVPSLAPKTSVPFRLPASLRCASNTSNARFANSTPSITQTSFWKSLIPKPFRGDGSPKAAKPKSRDWNPATFYIVIFLLIGSMSIQMISLRKNFDKFMRQSEVRIGLLREIVGKLHKGEAVDVEATLGSGDAESEAEWEQVIRDLEKNASPGLAGTPEGQETAPEAQNTTGAPTKPRAPATSEFY